ncbi:O-methyltransferase [Xylariales sp. PMI_506]|nr:O-methyltransferase [Xylariales sp. PMI_506]
MKSSRSVLYANDALADAVTEYAAGHSSQLPKFFVDYHAQVLATAPKSNYMISTLQAQYLVWLSHLIGAKRVLEIGVYLGFSSMVWSHAVGPDGTVTGLEYDPEYAASAQATFAAAGIKNASVVVGDGLVTLSELDVAREEPYDIVFIDAQKSGYPAYLRTILERSPPGSADKRLLRKGGLIIGDNALRHGLVAYDGEGELQNDDAHRRGDVGKIREFNDAVQESGRLDAFLVPLWDGLNIARLVD